MAETGKPIIKPNSGYLYPNTKKTHDKQPDYKGKLNDHTGKEWLLSAWKRTKDGEEMLSIALTDPAALPPRQGQGQGAPAPQAPATGATAPAASAAPAPTSTTSGPPLKEISPEFGDLFDSL